MNRLLAVAVSLSLGLVGAQGAALAQESVPPAITTTATGDCYTSGTPGNWTITCGDLGPGSGLMVVTPPVAVDTVPASTDLAPAPAPAPEAAPAAEPAPDTTGEAVATETTVATPTDQDADNFDDALEPEAGLDPTTADTDGDYVADGDEFNLYQTDPTIADTDGDGALDGEELFGTHTDPLLWEDGSETAATSEPAASSDAATEPAPASAPVAETTTPAETTAPVAADTAMSDKEAAYLEGTTAPPPAGTTENLSATSGGASSLGDGDASAVPGTVTRDGVTLSGAPLLGPDGTYRVSESSPPIINVSGETTGISVAPAPGVEAAAVAETATPVESAEPVAADAATATAADQDADNIADAQEAEIGLDASNPDTDADGVADGDEGTLYGTDPFTADTDGDGVTDGNELFANETDPLTSGTAGTA